MATVEAANREKRRVGRMKLRLETADLPAEQFGDLIAVAHMDNDRFSMTEQVDVDPFHLHLDAIPTLDTERAHPRRLHVVEDPDVDHIGTESLGNFAAVDLDPEIGRQCVEVFAIGHGGAATSSAACGSAAALGL